MPLRVTVRALFERGVIQILAAYLAAGWGLLQFTTWAMDWWHLQAWVVTAVLAGWLVALPGVVLFAWRRGGRPAAAGRAAAGDAAGAGDVACPPTPALPDPAPRSVAVLPFLNLGVSPEDAYLSDGISEELLAALARVDGLRVAARTSVQAYRAKDLDVRAIGRQLGVRCVLEGSVQRSGTRLRVSTRLVNVADGYQLWSARYDKEMADVFAIEDEIADNVVRVLRSVLRGQEAGEAPHVPRADVRAYEYYLRGRLFFSASRLKSLHYAREMFEKAIQIDPEYALAHAALAEAVALECMFYPSCGSDWRDAERASERALELDPELADAHAARGAVEFVAKRYEAAEGEFREALRLDPRAFDALYLFGRMCFQLGRSEEAAALFARACDVREDYQAAFFAAQSHEALGREEEAARMYTRALAIVETHMELNPDDPRAANMRAVSLCRLGRKVEGLQWAERAIAIDPQDAGVRYNAACLFALAGEADRAIELLEEALRAGFGNAEWIRQDPDLASLRGNPLFEALLGTASR